MSVQPESSLTVSRNLLSNKNNVLMQVATANVSNLSSNLISERVQLIFDSRCQRTYITELFGKRLTLTLLIVT